MIRKHSFFFCVGCQKSGTTLLTRVLDQHPDIACIWESYALMPQFKASIMNPASSSWKKHGFLQKDVHRWAKQWSALQKGYGAGLRYRALRKLHRLCKSDYDKKVKIRTLRDTMSEALTDFAGRCGATVVGDKWPLYIDYLDILLQAFPNARFIYNVRDPRGIWNSGQRFRNRKWGDNTLQKMLAQDKKVSPYLKSPNFITIRFEDLINEPTRTCQELYQFLGCEFSENFLNYDYANDPYPQRWEWIPEAKDKLTRWHTVKWKEQMTAKEIEQITRLASWFIEKYNYEFQL